MVGGRLLDGWMDFHHHCEGYGLESSDHQLFVNTALLCSVWDGAYNLPSFRTTKFFSIYWAFPATRSSSFPLCTPDTGPRHGIRAHLVQFGDLRSLTLDDDLE